MPSIPQNRARIAVAALVLLTLAGCAAGSTASQQAVGQGMISQLALGFWHGIIAPVTLIVEIINKFAPHALPWNLHVYEGKAAGQVPYDIGFYLGLVGGPSIALTRRRRVVD